MQSIAYVQQIYLEVDTPVWTTLEFRLSKDTINIKPHRAGADEAILGQCGNVLLHGVNGLYDIKPPILKKPKPAA